MAKDVVKSILHLNAQAKIIVGVVMPMIRSWHLIGNMVLLPLLPSPLS